MCDLSKKVRDAERIVSAVIEFLDPVQKGFGIMSNFVPLPNYLTSGETFLAIKFMVLILVEIYIFGVFLLHRMQQERLKSAVNKAHWVGHDVRPFLPVCILGSARIGRPPEVNLSLCHVIYPSPREGK